MCCGRGNPLRVSGQSQHIKNLCRSSFLNLAWGLAVLTETASHWLGCTNWDRSTPQWGDELTFIGKKRKIVGHCITSMKDAEGNSSACPTEQLLDIFFNIQPFFLCCPFKPETPPRTAFSPSWWEFLTVLQGSVKKCPLTKRTRESSVAALCTVLLI